MRFTFLGNRHGLLLCLAAATLVGVACSATSKNTLNETTSSATTGTVGSGGEGGAAPSSSEAGLGLSSGNGGGDSGKLCDSGENDDADKDGFTPKQGDCNDCDANKNPNAVEIIGGDDGGGAGGYVPSDENCDGNVDEAPMPCDAGLALGDLDPLNGARAIGLCKESKGPNDWGVVSAAYTRADGSPASPGAAVGLMPKFGSTVKPREGGSLLGLSSGYARDASMPGSCGTLTCYTQGLRTAPPGFPQDVPGCDGDTEIHDDVALSLKLRAPKNATGYSFEFNFYSFEYPEWVCTSFNDQFIALVNPPPMGSINGNISFDSKKNPVSVNIAFFQICSGCPLGTAELSGTGFDSWDDAGATSWLTTQAPVVGGDTFDVRFAIWDTGDQKWDSTVLVDNFKWIATPVSVNTVPTPK
jgi:hypothetical protein